VNIWGDTHTHFFLSFHWNVSIEKIWTVMQWSHSPHQITGYSQLCSSHIILVSI
jgi:hypothetical protein